MSSDPEEFDVAEYDVDADLDASDPDPAVCEDPAGVGAEPTACAYTDYAAGGADPEDLPATGEGATGVEAEVWDALYGVEDPEMPVSIVDLGLIYGVDVTERVDEGVHAEVRMTLTYTGCPARNMLTDEVEQAVVGVAGVESVDLRLVWSPEWSIEMVTDDGKDDLREFGLSV
ncbi:1,2-phenylacetyl-CoA epoxidase subunit PaaD [Halorussus halobius]|uniref:1,2-phenylacetyl-CoA epoxidase subunit PaaD n=1 Tax=Halorussus halobius TaxID=1710537 RepID=UPI0010932F54|nr:1,2-phenylacetyl-CoA epoxidase subunit PaaD [Halorussus halobius]